MTAGKGVFEGRGVEGNLRGGKAGDAVGEFHSAIDAAAFGERGEIDVGGAGDGSVVDQKGAVEVECIGGDVQGAAGIDGDAGASAAGEVISGIVDRAAVIDGDRAGVFESADVGGVVDG